MPITVNAMYGADEDRLKSDLRHLFHKSLAAWASDVLQLRAQGLDRPCYRGAQGPAMPWQPLRKAA